MFSVLVYSIVSKVYVQCVCLNSVNSVCSMCMFTQSKQCMCDMFVYNVNSLCLKCLFIVLWHKWLTGCSCEGSSSEAARRGWSGRPAPPRWWGHTLGCSGPSPGSGGRAPRSAAAAAPCRGSPGRSDGRKQEGMKVWILFHDFQPFKGAIEWMNGFCICCSLMLK